jgi:hypothetical protein
VTPRRSALLLLGIQLFLVLTVAGKYLYERKVCPRLWVRTTQYDPQLPLRGRYLALRPVLDGCGLPRDDAHFEKGYKLYPGGYEPGFWKWNVSLNAEHGKLLAHLQEQRHDPDREYEMTLRVDQPCDKVPVRTELMYFIPEHAQSPFPLKSGQELWVEITVPPAGPPRPIQLALSSDAGFKPLKFE